MEQQRDPGELEFVLFAKQPADVRRALDAGIESFMIDWEYRGKAERQLERDTEINRDSPEDLARLNELGCPKRYCRVNAMGDRTESEVELAVGAGATHIFLPLCESREEIRRFIAMIGDRAKACILVETDRAVENASEIAKEPVDMVYVGLNDLAISRHSRSIFEAVADRTVEKMAEIFSDRPFGFGGLTVVDGGSPVPCAYLMAEMTRLRTRFSFLRRSFKRDIAGRDMKREVATMREYCSKLRLRTRSEIEENREQLVRSVWDSLR
jgi:hypothetical protein